MRCSTPTNFDAILGRDAIAELDAEERAAEAALDAMAEERDNAPRSDDSILHISNDEVHHRNELMEDADGSGWDLEAEIPEVLRVDMEGLLHLRQFLDTNSNNVVRNDA